MIDENMNERPEPEALGPETGFELLDQVRGDLDDVEAGLRRLEDGTYGQCEACGGPIDEGRLAALPPPATAFATSRLSGRRDRRRLPWATLGAGFR